MEEDVSVNDSGACIGEMNKEHFDGGWGIQGKEKECER